LPEGQNNIQLVIELIAAKRKSPFYADTTSLLLGNIFEYLALLDLEELYDEYKIIFKNINLGLFIPDNFGDASISIEEILFEKEIIYDGYQEDIAKLEDYSNFKLDIKKKSSFSIPYRTDTRGLKHLRYLAHSYYNTPLFPDEWRNLF
jgi:hypothetical protein